MSHTGVEKSSTSAHSLASSGTMEKIRASAGTYKITKCSAKEDAIASRSHGLIQGGITNSEMSSEMALHALNISITTSTVSDNVEAFSLPSVK